MEKYINADIFRKELENIEEHGHFSCSFDFLYEYIERYAQEDRTPSKARWNPFDRFHICCSSCNVIWLNREKINLKYCPNCGAKMDVKEEAE